MPGYAGLKFGEATKNVVLAWDDESTRVSFPFVNQGKQDIEIKRVASSCGCTSILPGIQRTIKPGEKEEVRAEYDVGMRTGIQIIKLLIETDEDGGKVHTLQLVVNTPKVAQMAPSVLSWPHAADYQDQTMRINWLGEQTAELNMKLPDFPGWKISLQESVSGKEWLLSARPVQLEQAGMIQVPLVFESQNKKRKLEAILMTY